MRSREETQVRWVLALGLLCTSFPAILIRYAAAPALVIAFWRKLMAALLLVPLIWARRKKEPLDWALQRRLLPYTLGAGLILAVHFGTWIASVQYTTVASALLVTSTLPVWGGLMGFFFLGERVPPRGILAILLAMSGVALIAWGDRASGSGRLMGDGLALVASIAAAAYLTVGRHLRARVPLAQYLGILYTVAALALGASALAWGLPMTGFSGRTWLMFALLALIPSTLGHNLINYAIRHMEAYRINLAILVEPVVSTLLAALLFAEYPSRRFYFGAIFVVAGVLMALREPASGRTPEGG